MQGVVSTRVGYTGGTLNDPTYYSLGDHTESIEIEYDPALLSYEDLLEVFWSTHNPCNKSHSRQYMSAIFYNDKEQEKLALQTKAEQGEKRGNIATLIEPAKKFYLAEDYHQKYRLRNTASLMQEYAAMYPKLDDFINSTAVTRVNGYLIGYGTGEAFDKELPQLGLSDESQQGLRRRFESSRR